MRHLYSDSICAFILRAQLEVCYILARECGLRVRRTWFERGDYRWSIKVVVFDRAQMMGYFDPNELCIGLHHSLMTEAKWPVVLNVLRHELAHYLRWIDNGQQPDSTPHGAEFRALCASFGWGPEVFRAAANIAVENDAVEGDLKTDELMAKVKKLFALAESANPHEAELATRKANELIVKYNLGFLDGNSQAAASQAFSQLVDKEVLTFRRRSQKHVAIMRILETFGVFTVFSSTKIRVTGPEASVGVAEYVAQFLDRKLETLYLMAKKADPKLRGVTMKNSFFRGIGEGYLQKIRQDQAGSSSVSVAGETTAISLGAQLQQYQDTLADYVRQWVYPDLSTAKSSSKVHRDSMLLGQEVGQTLHIAQPITSGEQTQTRFLQ